MNRRQLYLVITLLLLVAGLFLGTCLVDPFADSPSGPELDLSESPGEIAHDALVQLEYRDYTVDRYRGEINLSKPGRNARSSASIRYMYREKYENTAQEYYFNGSNTEYVNAYFSWGKKGNNVGRADTAARVRVDRYWNEAVILSCDCVRVDRENESHIALIIENRSTLVTIDRGFLGSAPNGSRLRLVIDKRRKALASVTSRVIHNESVGSEFRTLVIGREVYSEWGTTEVERPSWATYTIEEAIEDIQNVEHESWVGSD